MSGRAYGYVFVFLVASNHFMLFSHQCEYLPVNKLTMAHGIVHLFPDQRLPPKYGVVE